MQQVLPEAPQSDEVGREPQEVYELKWPKLEQNAGYFNPNIYQKIGTNMDEMFDGASS